MHETLSWIRAGAMPLTSVEAGSGFADIEPLRALIGDARIVSLGEATHGTREFFQLKHRLLEFCVSELGFTMFCMEEDFSTALAANDYVLNGKGSAAQALSGFKWCWNTEEVLALIEWMRAWNVAHPRKVKFYGFDVSPTTPAALAIWSYLGRVAGDLAADCEANLAPLSADCTEALFGQLPASTQAAALACIQRVLAAFERERARWVAATSELEWQLARQHAIFLEQGARTLVAHASGDELGSNAIRDRAMAENVRWLLDMEGPDAKAVLWSHNGHAGRSSYQHEGTHMPVMGLCLHELFGRQQFVVGFAFNQGAFRAWTHPNGGLDEHSVPPAPAGSFEAPLAGAGQPMFALDLRSAPSPIAEWLTSPPRRSFGGTYSAEFEVRREAGLDAVWKRRRDMFDLILFVDSTTASRPNPSVVTGPAASPGPASIDQGLAGCVPLVRHPHDFACPRRSA